MTQDPGLGEHEYGMRLFPQHADLLRASGISVEVARERGYLTANEKAALGRLGFGPVQRVTPALVLPMWNVVGEVHGHQIRPDEPRYGNNGKVIKYETPRGMKMALDVHPRVRLHIGDPSRALVITEGIRKADAAISRGIDCIALIGVWNWRGTNDKGGKLALADWESIALNDRTVLIAFDSDAVLKEQVFDAQVRLGAFLASRHAHVGYVLLPPGDDGSKVGLDDFLAADPSRSWTHLFALAGSTPPQPHATVQPPAPAAPVAPPPMASDLRILNRFRRDIQAMGVVGEDATACNLYLALTTRLLPKPVSATVKGHSASGKSYTTQQVIRFFPAEAYIEMTAMSERALVYSDQDYRHRTLIIYEATALREGIEENLTAYLIRSLLSEGRIEYQVTVRDFEAGGFTGRTIVKDGPTNMILTTTKAAIQYENETRVLSFHTDDSRAQTGRVMARIADESDTAIGVDLRQWQQLQAWLTGAEHRVSIPYARRLAELIPPVAIRLRRDFNSLLALIRAHAMLHQRTRARDATGQIVANLDDYEVVRDLIADVLAEGVEAAVSPVVRETVEALRKLEPEHREGVPAVAMAKALEVDKSTASRRLAVARRHGYAKNLEDRRGRPGRWASGDPLPGDARLLPVASELAALDPGVSAGQEVADESGCAVARTPEGIETATQRVCEVCGTTEKVTHDEDLGIYRCADHNPFTYGALDAEGDKPQCEVCGTTEKVTHHEDEDFYRCADHNPWTWPPEHEGDRPKCDECGTTEKVTYYHQQGFHRCATHNPFTWPDLGAQS